MLLLNIVAVSYTHLDVYKRQSYRLSVKEVFLGSAGGLVFVWGTAWVTYRSYYAAAVSYTHLDVYKRQVVELENYDWKDSVWEEEKKKQDTTEKPMWIYEVHLGSWKKDEMCIRDRI